MKISLNWLRKYLDIPLNPEELSEVFTMIGLEVEGVETVESMKGGLEGVYVGEVKTCIKHPNADKLSLTTVDIGRDELLQIVCGAPNVAAGQKVFVVTEGSTLYTKEGESWVIKKGKIRGVFSEGMICSEDELGLGDNHDGIMVLDDDAKIGTAARDFLNLESDIVYEIALTPNRSDATSHIGVANDLAAYLRINFPGYSDDVKWPEVSDFKVDMHTTKMRVNVENQEACPRYSGVAITGLEIKDSPDWLKNYLRAIEVRPISNIVDITNFILHEMGQPLHAFDLEEIEGGEIIVRTLPEGTIFHSLDEVERNLYAEDLMICDGNSNGMCIGGVFGGINSGVKESTTSIFLEAAHFNPTWIRRSSMRHNLRTDAAKVFEKGSDPSRTVYALKRAALLIKELAGGIISSDIFDIYPHKIERKEIYVKYDHITRLIGTNISHEEIHDILRAMDMEIEPAGSDGIMVHVPTDKNDVTREVDVIEEILRIYGFNKVPLSEFVISKINYDSRESTYQFRDRISNILSNQGFNEMMGMSLVESRLYKGLDIINEDRIVYVNNTSNIHLDIMRPEMMISGLLSVVYNHYRQNTRLRLFEFGKGFQRSGEEYVEDEFLTIFLSGNRNEESWMNDNKAVVSFFDIKKVVMSIFEKLNIKDYQLSELEDKRFSYGVKLHRGAKVLAKLGKVSNSISRQLDLKNDVYYAELSLDNVISAMDSRIEASELSRFPSIRRDLAMVLDKGVTFDEIKKIAYRVDNKHIKEINLFDIYENKAHLGELKKSYAVSFIFSDDTKTLQDKEVEKIIGKIINSLKMNIGAEIRN